MQKKTFLGFKHNFSLVFCETHKFSRKTQRQKKFIYEYYVKVIMSFVYIRQAVSATKKYIQQEQAQHIEYQYVM